jgi:histidine kinase 2/3/4 (cytokinin receptor)
LYISAVASVDPLLGLNKYYNCSEGENPCEVRFFGNQPKPKHAEGASVPFLYGSLNLELQCWYTYNMQLHILQEMIAWPLLMLAVVLFCIVAEADVHCRKRCG